MQETITKLKYRDLTESQKQDINGKLVSKEVFCCVSQEYSYILEQQDGLFNLEDIENYYLINFEAMKDSIEENKELSEELVIFAKNKEKSIDNLSNEDLKEFAKDNDIDVSEFEEPQEIYEYWKVSNWLLEKLEQEGEPVLKDWDVWCRTTSGQSIAIDRIIYEICEELFDEYGYFDDLKKQILKENQEVN